MVPPLWPSRNKQSLQNSGGLRGTNQWPGQKRLTHRWRLQKKLQLRVVYDVLSELSLVNDVLRISGIDAPLIASLTATLGQVVGSFERLRMFSDYRTPSSIRVFIHLCIVLVPLLLIPAFARLAMEHASLPVVYTAGFLLPFPFMLLSNVQKGLENPFCRSVAPSYPPTTCRRTTVCKNRPLFPRHFS